MAKNKQQPGRVKSALLNWLGVTIGLTTGEFWQEWFGTSSSGKVVTADKIIRLSTVWACVRLLSEPVSTLPLKTRDSQMDLENWLRIILHTRYYAGALTRK